VKGYLGSCPMFSEGGSGREHVQDQERRDGERDEGRTNEEESGVQRTPFRSGCDWMGDGQILIQGRQSMEGGREGGREGGQGGKVR
jgi:hypothetical protein